MVLADVYTFFVFRLLVAPRTLVDTGAAVTQAADNSLLVFHCVASKAAIDAFSASCILGNNIYSHLVTPPAHIRVCGQLRKGSAAIS